MIHCVILAAGFGRRFGGDKLNAVVNGKPMYRHVLDGLRLLAAEGLCDVTLVTRPGVLADCPEAAYNLRAEEGISSSIRCGLDAIAEDGAPVAFFVADQPYLTVESIRRLLRSYETCGKGILCAGWEGRRGNPVIFARRYEDELRALTGDTGGRAVIRAHGDDVAICPVTREEELEDLDHGIGK